ncbi:hypothetical protein AAFF_G00078960 [Aldrovandia affinis]|uniref:Uncharacterized protein n=1 Tax=Aldrovandia affinis TaxID=143900 RepID=A0AAD7RXP0_9TELE|nr:hypothetical protein AAFF_G00078960 [Aldrovandia affinis]
MRQGRTRLIRPARGPRGIGVCETTWCLQVRSVPKAKGQGSCFTTGACGPALRTRNNSPVGVRPLAIVELGGAGDPVLNFKHDDRQTWRPVGSAASTWTVKIRHRDARLRAGRAQSANGAPPEGPRATPPFLCGGGTQSSILPPLIPPTLAISSGRSKASVSDCGSSKQGGANRNPAQSGNLELSAESVWPAATRANQGFYLCKTASRIRGRLLKCYTVSSPNDACEGSLRASSNNATQRRGKRQIAARR